MILNIELSSIDIEYKKQDRSQIQLIYYLGKAWPFTPS